MTLRNVKYQDLYYLFICENLMIKHNIHIDRKLRDVIYDQFEEDHFKTEVNQDDPLDLKVTIIEKITHDVFAYVKSKNKTGEEYVVRDLIYMNYWLHLVSDTLFSHYRIISRGAVSNYIAKAVNAIKEEKPEHYKDIGEYGGLYASGIAREVFQNEDLEKEVYEKTHSFKIPLVMDGELKRPPQGITPKTIWQLQRKSDLIDAMKRFSDENKTIPEEWITELNELKEIK